MRINRLDLNQLATLDALLSQRNVSRAAQQVHLSQPAVSTSLARLRNYFSDPLLVPAGRGFTLSPFAASLAQPVRDLLLQAQALTRRRPEIDLARIEREVTLVGSDYVFEALLAPLFQRAAREAPGLRFELRSVGGYRPQELDDSEVDLLLSSASTVSPLHPSEPLLRDTFSCVAWKDNTQVGQRLTRSTFLRLGHVAAQLGQGRVPTLDQLAFDAQGIARRVEIRVPSFTQVARCVVQTERIATLHTSLAHRLARVWPLRVLRCPVEIPPLVIALQWHRYQSDDLAIQWVRRALHEVVRSEGLTPAAGSAATSAAATGPALRPPAAGTRPRVR